VRGTVVAVTHYVNNGRFSPVVQTKAEKREADAVQTCHWTFSLMKRWLIGTHAGAVRPKLLHPYLDEFVFRHNRRKTDGVARIAARVALFQHACLENWAGK
jgi:ISXO2-like transposase domain